MLTRQWEGETLTLRAELAELFDKARGLYEAQVGMDDIMNLLLAAESPIWRDGRGRRLERRAVTRLPAYRSIKDMARRRGVSMGLLSEDRPGIHPEAGYRLEDFLHDDA